MTPPASSLNVKFEVGGTSVATAAAAPTGTFGGPPPAPQTSNSPVTVQWPSPSPRTAILVGYDNNSPPAPAFEKTGPWSMFRVIEQSALTVKKDTATATYSINREALKYEINSGSVRNPLNFSPLREFRCPGGI